MNEVKLPVGWEQLTLEKVAEVHDNLRDPVNSAERSKRFGSYPYYGATGQVGWIDGYRQDGEYVLLGEDGAPFFDWSKDKAYLVSGKCWVNNHAHVLKGREGLCLNRYLLYALNQIDYRGYANGTTRLKLTQSAMRQIPVNLVGACVIARKVTKKIMLSDKTLRIRVDGYLQEYFLQFLRSRAGRKQIMLLSTGNQESMRNIGQDRIRSIVVPISSNEEAAVVIETLASKLSEVDQLDQTIIASLQQSEALRQSILKKAFSGQLVAQDENDEPAAALLERIKEEKAGSDKASKTARART